MKEERFLLAVFNTPAAITGRIYQCDLEFLKKELDKIVARKIIGGASVNQSDFHPVDFEMNQEVSAGELHSYEIVAQPDGAIHIYGNVTLSPKSIMLRNTLGSTVGFSINSYVRLRLDEDGLEYANVILIRSFDFVTLRLAEGLSNEELLKPF